MTFDKKNCQSFLYFLFLTVVSFLFTAYVLTKRGHLGDQPWFAAQAEIFDYNYLAFAMERYQVWSSRFFIEALTMYFSVHFWSFTVTFFLTTFSFLVSLKMLFLKEAPTIVTYLYPCLLFIVFPLDLLISAGMIPTVVNYYFPVAWFVVAWSLLSQKRRGFRFLAYALLFIVFTQEQLAVVGVLLGIYCLIEGKVLHKKWSVPHIIATLMAFLGVILTVINPGNDNRLAMEISKWYPDFETLSVIDKLFLGFIDTNRTLFMNGILLSVYFFYGILLITALRKKQWLTGLVALGSMCVMVIFQFRLWTPFNQLLVYVNDLWSFSLGSQAIIVLSGFTLLLLLIVWMLFTVFQEKLTAVRVIVLLIIGYGSRMLVSFSPTIYASELRTYVVFATALYVTMILLLCEISNNTSDKKYLNGEELL